MRFKCSKCGREYQDSDLRWRCACGGSLSCKFTPVFTKEQIRDDRHSMWRYEGIYPLRYEDISITYEEGFTPLIQIRSEDCRIRVKMDQLMPTGSFKDRGTVMVVNYLKNHGVTMITEDSSGNAGASVAGYCALGGIPCEIYVPRGNSAGKLTQIRAYGASIYEIEGNREDVAVAAQEKSASYAGHNWHPLFIQGTKSLAYELWEQNGFKAPEQIVVSAGNGSTALGIYYGFRELFDNGQITRIPRLFVVQAEKCNPIYRTYKGLPLKERYESTIAEGIALSQPNKVSQIITAVEESGGDILCVTEAEIRSALKELALRGIYAEPTSSAAYAGIRKLCREQVLKKNDEVIMIISGNGLKAGNEIEKLIKEEQKSEHEVYTDE